MLKIARIIAKVLSLIVGIVFLAFAFFEFMIIIRGETSLFESQASAIWLYSVRGVASLSCFLLAISLIIFPKTIRPLADLIASAGIVLIVGFSYLLMELYLYIPLLAASVIALAIYSLNFLFRNSSK